MSLHLLYIVQYRSIQWFVAISELNGFHKATSVSFDHIEGPRLVGLCPGHWWFQNPIHIYFFPHHSRKLGLVLYMHVSNVYFGGQFFWGYLSDCPIEKWESVGQSINIPMLSNTGPRKRRPKNTGEDPKTVERERVLSQERMVIWIMCRARPRRAVAVQSGPRGCPINWWRKRAPPQRAWGNLWIHDKIWNVCRADLKKNTNI